MNEGEFFVLLKYACPKSDLGSKLRIEVGGNSLSVTVDKPHESVMLPSADRIHRKEVYEKTWSTINAGTVLLEKGRTQLRIRALEIPGNEALELKAVHLIRKR